MAGKSPRRLHAEITEITAALAASPPHAPTRGFDRFRALPADPERGDPLAAWGAVHADKLGSYWTIATVVPLPELLSGLRPIAQSPTRLRSIATARRSGIALPPIEIGVFRDGTAWIVDGNHRLVDARRANLPDLPAIFTFVGS